MSILIKGMEMPKSCDACELAALVDISDGLAYGCRALKEMIYNDRERLPNCPLFPVPPHGRLIDADALLKLLDSCMFPSDMVTTRALSMATNWLKEAQTVIHADKDGEE